MGKYFAGINSGTTGTSVVIFDEKGNVISSGYSEYTTTHPYPGWINQDMNELLKGVYQASKMDKR